ncbi:MAG: maleylacetoacetate isomerase [Alphaproteobacteria bacterium]|nr:maleylacetoacetate isomerase [Alphaproteobacteria bacterium]
MTIRLYDYWRSSAAYRVRIALNLKAVAYERVTISLMDGAQKAADYKAKNPQGFVPMLEVGDLRLTQSLAIIDWLDATYATPRFVPADPAARAAELGKALLIAADIHPINNLRILKYLRHELGQSQDAVDTWARHWISEGFAALEALADADQPFLSGAAPGLADICLIPQMANARRVDTPLDAFPKLVAIDARACALPAFAAAHPDAVKPD